MDLEKLYQQLEIISDQIFRIVQFWTPFVKQIIGIPFQSSIDKACITVVKTYQNPNKSQVLLPICYENITEVLVWLEKSRRRKLILKKDYQHLYGDLNHIQNQLLGISPQTNTKPKPKKSLSKPKK